MNAGNNSCSPPPPWQRLAALRKELPGLESSIAGKIHPTAVVEGVLSLAEGSEIKAGTVIEGFVRIGRNCSVGPNAYLRGCCEIGDGCRVGHAVELKDCILGNMVFVSHLSYLGDSILEDDVNLGGGCILSNFRHDAGLIRMPWQGQLCETGCDKLGAYIGAHARIGCNSVLLPGRVLPEGCQTAPGTIYRG